MKISEHAALRYQQRIDSSEDYPRETLRQLVEEGQPSRREEIEGLAIAAREALVVVRDDVVTTVLRDPEAVGR